MSSKEEAEFAAVLAEVEAATTQEDASEVDDNSEVLMETEEGEDVLSQEDSDTTETDDTEATDDEPLEVNDNEAFRTEVADLFDKGNLKKACEKLGIDPEIFKINNRQFAAIRKGETEARRYHTEAEAKLTQASQKEKQAETLHQRAEEVYGPIVAGNKAAKKGDWSQAKAAIELMFEMPAEQVFENIKKGVKPLDPAQAEVLKLRAELEEERAKKNQEDVKATESAQYAKDVQTVTSKLASTPLAGVEGAAEEIVNVIRASYNPGLKKYALTLKEAYAQVKASYQKKAEQLAKLSGKPAAGKPAKTAPAPTKPSRTPLSNVRKPSTAKVSEDDEFAASIAEAAKAASAAERRNRRAR